MTGGTSNSPGGRPRGDPRAAGPPNGDADLPVSLIKEILIARAQVRSGRYIIQP